MEPEPSVQINFDNTEIAFSHKTDKELKELKWLFSIMNNNSLVSLGSAVTPLALKLRLPFVKLLIRSTIFKQFVGGENLLDTQNTIDLLFRYNTLTVLDYGAESKSTEEELDQVMRESIKAIELAAANNSVPVISTKLTGLAPNALLIKMQTDSKLTESEQRRKAKLISRLDNICKRAYDLKVGVMIDAEESWMQDTIDNLVNEMMACYNKQQVIVYNTYQLYRHDRLDYLKASYEHARTHDYFLGAKLVRGAYMEKEREYARAKGRPSPINPDKPATDRCYNDAVRFCVKHYKDIGSVCASHNRDSNRLQAELIEDFQIERTHPHLNFCQLLGMSDNITFNLAAAGYNVAKYVPYGPIDEVIPYLIRRAEENTSVTGDMSRELQLIVKEIERRGLSAKTDAVASLQDCRHFLSQCPCFEAAFRMLGSRHPD